MGQDKMKNKSIIIFGILVLINSILGFCLYHFNKSEEEFSFLMIFGIVIFSLLIFWIFYGYLIFTKNNLKITFYITSIIGVIFLGIVSVILIRNLKSNPILFFPLMFIMSLDANFIIVLMENYKSTK